MAAHAHAMAGYGAAMAAAANGATSTPFGHPASVGGASIVPSQQLPQLNALLSAASATGGTGMDQLMASLAVQHQLGMNRESGTRVII